MPKKRFITKKDHQATTRTTDEQQMYEDRVPNAETLAAMEELEAGKGDRATGVAEMMAKLNADD